MIKTQSSAAPGRIAGILETTRDLVWTAESVPLGRALAAGALAWFFYSVLVVLVRGVVLDQDLIPAQVISGAVNYTPGHPHDVFYRRVFNLLTYLMAGLWRLAPNVEVLSAIRNCLFVFLSAFTPFAMATVITRRPAYGFIAATFTLSETADQLQGVYPMMTYPDFNSDGHIGAYFAVLTVTLLLGRFWRLGGLLLGLLPAIHPTLAAVVWPWGLLYIWAQARRNSGRDNRRLLLSAGLGLAVCAALACVIFLTAPKIAPQPPYASAVDGPLAYRHFEETSDFHRRPLSLSSLGYSVHPVVLFTFLALLMWKAKRDDASKPDGAIILWLLVMSLLAWGFVVFGTAFRRPQPGSLAGLIQISMPGRFSNLTALTVLPLSVALIARARQAASVLCLLLLIQAVVTPVDHALLERYFIFVIFGAALAADVYLRWNDQRPRVLTLLAPGLVAGALTVLYLARDRKGIGFLCAGFLLAVAAWSARVAAPSWFAPALALPTLLLCLGIPMKPGPSYRLTPYDRELNAWLKTHTAPGEPLLTPMGPLTELQAKTGHPVLMEPETAYMMTYIPSLAGVIGGMARDLYGIDYTDLAQLSHLMTGRQIILGSSALMSAWQAKTPSEWRSLGRKYSFRLVVSPTGVSLPLVPALAGPQLTLYLIE